MGSLRTTVSAARRLAGCWLVGLWAVCPGCRAPQARVAESPVARAAVPPAMHAPAADAPAAGADAAAVELVAHQGPVESQPAAFGADTADASSRVQFDELAELEAVALAENPTLRRLQWEAAAAWAKTRYVDKLPDPELGGVFFVPPMNFDPDRQVADLQLMQTIPWLGRLKAQARQACFEALAAENMYQAERVRLLGDLRAAWYRLYALQQQIDTTLAEQAQLEALIATANARVATGDAQPGDVLLATLELTSLEEQLISARQQSVATVAEINRLLGRDAALPLAPPTEIDPEFPDWDHEFLRATALESQPEVAAARLRAAATRWGVEVARLQRRPDLTFGVGWIPMDAPAAAMAGAGRDSLTLGLSTTLPLSGAKYGALESEAVRQHRAAHASLDEVVVRLDAQLRDLWEQARASHEAVQLYETSILPLARQTFEADQQALANNAVPFERVVRDYRTLLNLQAGYHRALAQQATAVARIRQTVGVDLQGTASP